MHDRDTHETPRGRADPLERPDLRRLLVRRRARGTAIGPELATEVVREFYGDSPPPHARQTVLSVIGELAGRRPVIGELAGRRRSRSGGRRALASAGDADG